MTVVGLRRRSFPEHRRSDECHLMLTPSSATSPSASHHRVLAREEAAMCHHDVVRVISAGA
jgi:hypothetical protein